MRSLRALDAELTRRRFLFGREEERSALCDHLVNDEGGVLLAGLEGMGKSTLMWHALRDIGGVAANGPRAKESGHSLYFEDLGTFVQFLGVRNRPISYRGARVRIKWDEGGERREKRIDVVRRGALPSAGGNTTVTGTSSVRQTDRMVVEIDLDAVLEPRFDVEGISERMSSSLSEMADRLVRSLVAVRRSSSSEGPVPTDGRERFTPRIVAVIAGFLDGSVQETDRPFSVVLNLLEGELGLLVEGMNKQVYLSASTFLRRDDRYLRRTTLREFEEGLLEFLDHANMDRLIPGDSTFWRWYFGINALERGLPGWTLEMKRQAVRLLYERFAEREGFRLVAAMESDPRLLFSDVDDRSVSASVENGRVALMRIGMPRRDDLVPEVSAFVARNVEDLSGLAREDVRSAMEALYDMCQGHLRLYHLVRNIRNLPAVGQGAPDAIESDTSFFDRQVNDALDLLGIRREYEQSVENVPSVQPLLALAALLRPCEGQRSPVSKGAMAWLLDASDVHEVGVERYIEVMEMNGILALTEDNVLFHNSYVEWEAGRLSSRREMGSVPLVRTLLSSARLRRFLDSVSRQDLLDLSPALINSITALPASVRTDQRLLESLLVELDGDRKEKAVLLLAICARGGVAIASDLEEGRPSQRLFAALEGATDPCTRSLLSRGLSMMVAEGGRCASCGAVLGKESSRCGKCLADHRPVCARCGSRNPTLFTYCSGCGVKLA